MDTQLLLGNWQPLRAELDQELAPTEALEKMRLILDTQGYRVTFGGEISDRGSWSAKLEDARLTLTLIGEKGVNAGRTILALAQTRGDRLRICYGLNGERPNDFVTTAGSARYLVNYRRADGP